jgi:hypothetical protein
MLVTTEQTIIARMNITAMPITSKPVQAGKGGKNRIVGELPPPSVGWCEMGWSAEDTSAAYPFPFVPGAVRTTLFFNDCASAWPV